MRKELRTTLSLVIRLGYCVPHCIEGKISVLKIYPIIWTIEAFYNEILHYYSIFPHGFSLRNKGE